MIGNILVKVAFLCAILSGGLYFYTFKKNTIATLNYARFAYQGAVFSIMGFAAFLLYLILTHQFQYNYVWNYSSTDLPTPLLVSTFYAGQEGSFSLWALYTSIIGVFLMGYTARKGYEPEVMAVWSLILSFLLLMLLVKNPFEMIWDAFPKDLIHTGPVPIDMVNFVWIDKAKSIWAQYPSQGRGLNPLLQNYWMVIHPQILFTGFTSMAVPYTFAIAGLMRRDYQTWVKIAKPWTVFGATALGTGIILGGYWAYETLGWGGYWGWDPVENSSLIPWLVNIASVHTIMAQRRSGTFVRTNFVLSMLCFLMVLYSTFLTRSGVLGDTSVHSFVDPGMWAYWILLGAIFLFGGVGAFLFMRRSKEMPKIPVEHSIYSREFALFLGAFAIVFAAFFITIGTSSPIITQLIKGRKAAIDTVYYVKTTLPVGIFVAFLMGIGQLLWWQNSNSRTFFKGMIYPLISTVLFTAGLFYIGVRDLPIVLFVFASSFALFVNIFVGYTIFKGNPRYAGGAIAHIGLAFLFLGFVASARYDDKQTVSLEEGKPTSVLNDYTLTYTGEHQIDAERYGFNVEVDHGDRHFTVMPVMRFNNESNGMMRHPDILNMYTKDFYVSPLSLETPDQAQKGRSVNFNKGETKELSGMKVTFMDYDFSDAEKGKMVEGGGFKIAAIFEVEKNGKKEQIRPLMQNDGGSISFIPVKSSFSPAEFTIVKLQPNREDTKQSKIEISVSDPSTPNQPKVETLVIEASVKPYINLVWMGTITLIVGFVLTIVRRVQEAKEE
ncbi:MAG: heme lyase CcmF/NrfE family subunit [Bacteroidota bacterium]